MPLTPEQTKSAFLAKMPRMRAAFAQRIVEFKSRIFHESDYLRKYPAEILRLAQEEMRARNLAAEEGVKGLLDSGWTPAIAGQLRAVFTSCFVASSYTNDPLSDLYWQVDRGYSDIGQPEPAGRDTLRLLLSRTQVEAAEEALQNLDTYVVRKTGDSYTVHNHAPITFQQVGSNNAGAINQSTTIDVKSIGAALNLVRSHLNDFPADVRDEVETHVLEVEEELKTAQPRPGKLKASLAAIGRIAGPTGLEALKAAIAAAVGAVVTSAMGG